jgi:hypothetical protein
MKSSLSFARYRGVIALGVLGMIVAVACAAGEGKKNQKGGEDLLQQSPGKAVAVPEEIPAGAMAFRIRLGLKDAEPSDWSGTAEVSPGKVESIRGWRWAQGDNSNGSNFTVRTRRQALQGQNNKGKKGPVADTGIVVLLSGVTPESKVTIKTNSGEISFDVGKIPYGKRLMQLKGEAEIEQVPAVTAVAQTAADEDYPAAAMAKDGTAYVAYLSFYRGNDFQGVRERVAAFDVAPTPPALENGRLHKINKPEDLEYLREPANGERLFLRALKDGKWAAPVVVADKGEEMYRPAIAVDGAGKVWIFYSAHLNADKLLDGGDWELLARSFDPASGKVSDSMNISNAAGTDFMPAAASDSTGKVNVVWIGARGEHFNVFVANQTADGFTKPQRVTGSASNEWEPAIAADRNGNVAVAWDTYQKGDYDVYLSTRNSGGSYSTPVPVAATLNFEVRPSLAYDSAGRLWVAWEQGGELWGKDFGALKKKGNPLYMTGRSVGVKTMDTSGKWFSVPDVMEATNVQGGPNAGKNANAGNGNGKGAGKGKKNAPAGLGQLARARGGTSPCYPRIITNDQGQVFLAFRGRHGPNFKVGVGSVWFEYLTMLEGDEWTPAAWIPHSNNILDNRPALLAGANHSILMFFSGDGRGDMLPPRVADPHTDASAPAGDVSVPTDADAKGGIVGAGGNQARQGRRNGGGPDPNDDIFLTTVHPDSDAAPAEPKLTPAEVAAVAKPGPDVDEERTAVKTIRGYRVNLNGENLRIWRGEFHRHTELSPDGGGDGGLLDMWRYTIDAASLDWVGDGDHDYGNGREYSWWTTQKAVTLFTIPEHFVPMFCYERSVVYPEGHRNCMFAVRGIRSLPRLPLSSRNEEKPAPDTNLLYMYLHYFNGVCAAHTSATSMGTDWRNNDPAVEPFVEIYQGDRNNYERPDAPRSAVREAKLKQSTPEEESFGGYEPKGFVNLALLKGYRLAFESSSDHISTHMSFTNVYVTEPTRQAVVDAIKKRRVYGSTANIVADVRMKTGDTEKFMGEEFSTSDVPTLNVHLIGALKIAHVTIVKDDVVVYESSPNEQDVKFTWTDPKPTPGKTCYYYVRGEQVPDMEGATGELVWASPMWIKYEGK